MTPRHRPQGDFSTDPTHFDHDKSPKVIVMIVIEQAQFLPTVLYLSPWMQSAASTRVCPSVCVCLCERQCVPVRSPLAAGRCAGNRERQCYSVFVGIMKSSQHALQRGSTVKPYSEEAVRRWWWWRSLGRSSQQPSNNTAPP